MRVPLASFTLLVGALFVSRSQALKAPSIQECPTLAPRKSSATSVQDLRPDDIKVVGTLGDSILTGFAAKGVIGDELDQKSFTENRGVSYGGGGDPGAITIPNLIKNYSPDVKGGSLSTHLPEVCYGPFCDPDQYIPDKDVLNAAQSGAVSMNLDHQLDYLITAMKFIPGIDFHNDWKLINIQIGSNDQCASCINYLIPLLTPKLYGKRVSDAVERIRKAVPRVIVNLIGNFNVTGVYEVSTNQSYCQPFKDSEFIINQVACPCALKEEYRPTMNQLSTAYSMELRNIHENFKSLQTDSFGVIYTPANIDLSSFALEGLSNVDCFHPTPLGHGFIAKIIWNTFFLPLEEKPKSMIWDGKLPVYCPTEDDRFQLS